MKKWKNRDAFLGNVWWLLLLPVYLSGAEGSSPRLLETGHWLEPVVIGYHVEEIPGIRVDRSGRRDMSGELQKALDWVFTAGGGVLYLPAGEYRLNRPIEIPPLVGLRGDFTKPDGSQLDRDRNTVLAIYYGRGKGELDRACITVDGSASIDGFVIWYPKQSGKRVVSYSPAIRHFPLQSIWGINTSSRNLYLVNAYHGIAIGTPDKGTCIQLVKNVYGTPLGTGVEIWRDADIPRLLNLDFDPAYLGTSGLPGMAEFEQVARKHLLEEASAIRYHRTDGSALADIRVRGYHIGLELLKGTRMSNGHWIDNEGHYINFDFRDCEYGVWIDEIKDHGTQFFNCHFEAENTAVFINNPKHNAGLAMFLKCTLIGGDYAIRQLWQGEPNPLFSFMVTECTFGNTVDWESGTLSILKSRFEFEGKHARLGEHTVHASLVDNVFLDGNGNIDQDGGSVALSQKELPKLDVPDYDYRENFGSGYKPSRSALFNAMDFGAVPEDGKDDSRAIQTAIDMAHADGGGYVLIPAGTYRIDFPITVKRGVELRGVADFWQHSRTISHFNVEGETKGTLLMVYHGKGETDICTFLIEEDAGVNGLALHYPGQRYDKENQSIEEVYPWLFRLKGDRSYLKHIMASNPWRMVDGFTYSPENIYLGYLCGAPLDVSIQLGENDSPFLDNCHFNSWYWNHVFWENKPSEQKRGTAYKEYLDNWMKANSKSFVLEGTRNLDMYGCFQFCVNKAFVLKKGTTSGKGPSGIIINSGNDWAKFGLYAHANDGLQFVNAHFIDVNMYDPDMEISSIYFASDMSDVVQLFQVSTWGTSPRFVWMEGQPSSQLQITNLSYQLYNTDQLNRIESGNLTILNSTRRRSRFPIDFRLGQSGSGELYSALFPFPYSLSGNDAESRWVDRFGNVDQ